MDRGAWRATVHGATESHTRLSMRAWASWAPDEMQVSQAVRCRSGLQASPWEEGELLEEASCLKKETVQSRDPWREGFRFQESGSAPGPGL